MKYLLLIFTLLATSIMAQEKSIAKTIEVTGSHQSFMDPETITFNINIEEYWQEEFEGKKWEDFKTKIEIETIEASLINELSQMGITMDQITLKQTGNYWRSRGKDFLINKNLEIKLNSFEKANELSNQLKTRGIKSMNVAKLDHSQMESLVLQTKTEALKKAKVKAELLVGVYGKTLGEVISIVEIDRYVGISPPMQGGLRAKSMAMESSSAPSVQYENFRKIQIEENVRVLFEIK